MPFNENVSDTSSENFKSRQDIAMSDDEILEIAKTRFDLAVEAESANRIEELDDKRFMVGEQWPQDIKQARASDNRPCLVINRIPQFVRQITNDQRQNRPSIKINPVDNKADVETSKIIQGMVMHIEYNSHADIAYDTGFEGAVTTGLGYWRVVTEFADSMSFQQEIKIKRVPDRFSVYLDPFFQEPDGSDANWGFIFEDMAEDDFKAQYPNAKLSDMSDWESVGNMSRQWVQKSSVRVAEYYYKVYEETEIALLSDGSVIEKAHFDKTKLKFPDGVRIVRERKTLIPRIKWCKINGIEILERTDVPGEWVPIIPVIGEEQIVDGKRIFSGIIRHAKDPQRMLNYWKSAETEAIALAPRTPWVGVEGQFEGYESQWKTANTKNHAYLQYKPVSLNGTPAPAPQRQTFEPAVQAITQASMQSIEDLKGTTGIYDATLGNRSNEQSGVAIQRRNLQAQTSNFHFTDNLSRSLRHTGRILVAWIPKVYDTPQVVRIIQPDGQIDMVAINQTFQEDGEDKSYHLDLGRYDVTVDTGPSFQTKRQEAVTSMIDLAKVAPQAMQFALDLLVRSMDWPMSQEIADRLKKMLPPQLQDDGKDGPQIPPQAQQQIQQQTQMINMLTQHLEEANQLLEKKQAEIASRERIAALQAQTQLTSELIKHDAKDAQIAFTEEMRHIQHVNKLNDQSQFNGPGGSPAASPMTQQPAGGFDPAAQGAQQ